MTPTPIANHTVSLVLRYVLPPSQLAEPLPQHLISTPLFNRHKFLSLTPDSPEYLCWSADSRNEVIRLLEDQGRPVEDDLEAVEYDVRYASDEEQTFAFARIPGPAPPGVRFAFLWEGDDGWTFHDAALMPFPSHSHRSLEAAVDAANAGPSLAVPQPIETGPLRPVWASSNAVDLADEEDDDSYWNSYGADGDAEDRADANRSTLGNDPEDQAAEDAYWAQYSSVQGTADSTIPSPLPAHRRKHMFPPGAEDDGSHSHGHSRQHSFTGQSEMLSIPHSTFGQRPYVEGQPPSPHTLSHLLSNIPPRPEDPLSLRDLAASGKGVQWTQSRPLTPVSDEMCPPNEQTAAIALNSDVDALGDAASNASITSQTSASRDPAEAALKQTIAGLYRVWKLGRVDGGQTNDFMGLVRGALAQEE